MGKLSRLARLEAGAAPMQYAALPWRRSALGHVEVLLVTSRGTCRWIIPKGWPVKGKTASASAAQEAWEEAGVVGRIAAEPLGVYRYDKVLDASRSHAVEVEIFPLEVTCEEAAWPERTQRERLWVKPADAAQLVCEPELQAAILGFKPG